MPRNCFFHRVFLLALALSCLLTAVASASFSMPQEAPVARLIRNIQTYIKAHPKDASGYYQLGRVHYLAYVLGSDHLPAYNDQKGKLPKVQPFPYTATKSKHPKASGHKTPRTAVIHHLWLAKKNLEKAISLLPKNALYHLTLGSALDQGAENAWQVDAATQPRDWQGDLGKIKRRATLRWQHKALDQFRKAYELSIDKDRNRDGQPLRGVTAMVSHEAAKDYIDLVKKIDAGKTYQKPVAKMKKAVAELKAKPQLAITPVIFSLKPRAKLADLIAKGKTTRFDLDGTGRGDVWPWVKPDTGILIWDPNHTGRITSGRQLFGSVTWWIFWDNGYQALAALDDNGDGKLAGKELTGIRVWFDRNGNGKTDAGEVVSLKSLHITALATRPAEHTGRSLTNPRGITFANGKTLPTWDWVADSVKTSHTPAPIMGTIARP